MPRRSFARRLLPLAILPLLGAGSDPSVNVALVLAVVYVVALVGGELAVRVGQPAVLGELLGGVLVGNLSLLGFTGLAFAGSEPGIDLLARLGVLILLFEVGLESNLRQMIKVGVVSFVVAVIGVVVPFGLGWLVGAWLLPSAGTYVHAFLGATLSATSVGITARVLKDLGEARSAEARIILGAAVIDDVLGLVVLAVVTGVIVAADTGVAMNGSGVVWILVRAVGFLLAAVAVGGWLSPRLVAASSKFKTKGAALSVSLALCFLTAFLSYLLGLAPIIGAFAAGLVLEPAHYRYFTERGEQGIDLLLHPLVQTLVPVFFVLMGMRTDLAALIRPGVIVLAVALTVVAIVGKLACGIGVGKGADRWVVGTGMIPRGEVGLIFANVGLGLSIAGVKVISQSTYSAVVAMVILTTMVTPPALKWSFGRARRSSGAPA